MTSGTGAMIRLAYDALIQLMRKVDQLEEDSKRLREQVEQLERDTRHIEDYCDVAPLNRTYLDNIELGRFGGPENDDK